MWIVTNDYYLFIHFSLLNTFLVALSTLHSISLRKLVKERSQQTGLIVGSRAYRKISDFRLSLIFFSFFESFLCDYMYNNAKLISVAPNARGKPLPQQSRLSDAMYMASRTLTFVPSISRLAVSRFNIKWRSTLVDF